MEKNFKLKKCWKFITRCKKKKKYINKLLQAKLYSKREKILREKILREEEGQEGGKKKEKKYLNNSNYRNIPKNGVEKMENKKKIKKINIPLCF